MELEILKCNWRYKFLNVTHGTNSQMQLTVQILKCNWLHKFLNATDGTNP